MTGMTSRAVVSACRESRLESMKLLTDSIGIFTGSVTIRFKANLDTIVMNAPSIFSYLLCRRKFPCDSYINQNIWTLYHTFSGFETIETLLVEDVAYGASIPSGLVMTVRSCLSGLKLLKLNPGWPKDIEGVTDLVRKSFSDAKIEKYWPDDCALKITSLWLNTLKQFLSDITCDRLNLDESGLPRKTVVEIRASVCTNIRY